MSKMKARFRLFRRGLRGATFYCIDTTTGKRSSLETKDPHEAKRLLHAKNETANLAAVNLKMARVYLQAADPQATSRTWQYVMDHIVEAILRARKELSRATKPFVVDS